jgi:replicative DNA helicase
VLENSCRSGSAGILFTLEMDQGNCMDRMLSSVGGIRYGNMRSGNLEDVDWARNMKASNEINDYRMFMDDTPAIGLREINSKCRKLKRNGLDLVVIDYLQLMATNSAVTNRVQAIGEISRGLKRLARELECTVMLLSQLNRGVDGRVDKRPTMSDLRGSGEIEQDADVILFPFRSSSYCQKCKDNVLDGDHDPALHKRAAEVIIEKQRNGERNISVPVTWFGEYQRFQG